MVSSSSGGHYGSNSEDLGTRATLQLIAINKVGIYRYIEKPWNNDELIINIKSGLERSHLISNLQKTVSELSIAKQQLENHNKFLEEEVTKRTKDLQSTTQQLRTFARQGLNLTQSRGDQLQFLTTLLAPPDFMTQQKTLLGRDLNPRQ